MPLAVGKVMDDSTLKQIADAHNVTPAQIALAWVKQRNMIAIPSSTKARNIQSNIAAFDLALSDSEMSEIATLDRKERIANPDFAPAWDE